MPDSNGAYTRSDGVRSGTTVFQQQDGAGLDILATQLDAEANDMATALNNRIFKNGSNTPSANLPMGGFKHTNVATATAAGEYARLDQVQNSASIWAGVTAGNATAYTATLTPAPSALVAGLTIRLKPHTENTGTATLDLNGLGAEAINVNGVGLKPGYLALGRVHTLVYDGTAWELLNPFQQYTNWTPTITANNSVTVSGVTVNAAIYAVDGECLTASCHIDCSLSGSAATEIYISAPRNIDSNFKLLGTHWTDIGLSGINVLGPCLFSSVSQIALIRPDSSAWPASSKEIRANFSFLPST